MKHLKFSFKKFKKFFLGGALTGGAWCWGGVGWGINAGKVREKYLGTNLRGGGSVGGVFKANKSWGENFFGGGHLDKV